MNFEITPLFSTPIYHSSSDISNFKKEHSFLESLEFIAAKKNKVSKNTNVLSLQELNNYREICNSHLECFANNVFNCKQQFYITNSWIAITAPNESHHIHHHPNSIISGVLYLQSNDKSGSINFHHKSALKHSFEFNYDFVNYNLFNSDMWSYTPKTGEVLIFPSWVNHSVNINQSNVPRIILGFNAFAKGTFGNNEYSANLDL